MTILNPEHLFDQAEKLVAGPPFGSSRQADLRRGISSAYYGLFHFTLAALADEFVGVTKRATTRYVLVYRSVDHRTLKDICGEVRKSTPSTKHAPYFPSNGFGLDLQAFATAVIELQEKRHRADYDPAPRYRISDATIAIQSARIAVRRFKLATRENKKTFLTLLLCPPR